MRAWGPGGGRAVCSGGQEAGGVSMSTGAGEVLGRADLHSSSLLFSSQVNTSSSQAGPSATPEESRLACAWALARGTTPFRLPAGSRPQP